MLYCAPAKSRTIERIEQTAEGIFLFSEKGRMRIQTYGDQVVRITYTERDHFSQRKKEGIVASYVKNAAPEEREDCIRVSLPGMTMEIHRETGAITYFDRRGEVLLRENQKHGKALEEFVSYVPYREGEVRTQVVKTADGEKELIQEVAKVPDEKLYHTRYCFCLSDTEAIYGFGQNEENLLNLRNQTVYVHQANRKIAMPMFVSSRKYGILVNTYSPMIFHDGVDGTYFYTQADDEMDFFFMTGENLMEVIKGYRMLTGKAALLPKWAFGYMQSQERYETAREIVEVAKEHRDRGIGLDCIVLDWCSWEDGMWGQKGFDPKRFPDPTKMIQSLHHMDVHFMISIWPNMAKGTPDHAEMEKEKGLLFASDLYNPLEQRIREVYWKQAKEALFCHGVDAWWCDSSEPLTVEWVQRERMEPGILFHEYCNELQNRLPMWQMNAYPFYHAKTMFEGQRSVTRDKRVCNLTRSAYTGQQRFGTIMWSGDTSASWETFRAQIAQGLNFVSSGMPYWTVDIGAFFVKPGNIWYWDGEYENPLEDGGYLELYTRWYQWAAFLPVFRGHGTDVRRELWNFQGKDGRFYEAMLSFNRLRYKLLPYIYSQAGKTWLKDELIMRPLVFDFNEDPEVYDCKDQYMFGDSLMICPVTEPMYYEKGDKKLEGKRKTRKVYLPKNCGFYDFWTGDYYEGGRYVEAQATIDRIPIFVKEGSILPIAEESDRVWNLPAKEEREKALIRVYTGKNAEYEWYQDAGDGYAYEEGEYSLTVYRWQEDKKLLLQDGKVVERVQLVERK